MSELGPALYLDSSAIVKLVKPEPESAALAGLIAESELHMASGVIAEVEVLRSIRNYRRAELMRARAVLDGLILIPMTASIRARAAQVDPRSVRSLDAIHVATAIEIRPYLNGIVTYDLRMAAAAEGSGLPVVSPGIS